METAKSQLRLRSLDVGGRSTGTGRPSLVPSEGVDFLSRLDQGLEQALAREQGTRRERRALASEHAAQRNGQAEREQMLRRQAREERLQEAQEQVDQRAEERRGIQEGDSVGSHRPAQETRRRNRTGTGEENMDPAGEPSSQAALAQRPGVKPEVAGTTEAEGGTTVIVGEKAQLPAGEPLVQPLSGSAASGPASVPVQPQGASGAGGTTLIPTGKGPAPQSVAARGSAPGEGVQLSQVTKESARGTQGPKGKAPSEARPAPSQEDLQRAESVLRQVRVALRPELRAANIDLTPAELGRVLIRLQVKGKKVHAVVRAEQDSTLALLERHLPELRAMLGQGGMEGAVIDLGLADRGRPEGSPWETRERPGTPTRAEEPLQIDPGALARPLARAEGRIDFIA